MKILCDKQGTEQWKDARKGKITASEMRKVLAGKGTKGRRLYIEKLADDLEGVPDFEDAQTPDWFALGKYYESFGRGWYSYEYDVEVEQTGFVVHDDYSWIGCSPDGLIGDDGLLEIKHRQTLRIFKDHASRANNAPVMPQIQAQLFVTGRDWCDYLNYWRDDANEFERGNVKRIYRDDAYIDNTILPACNRLWIDVQALLRKRGVV